MSRSTIYTLKNGLEVCEIDVEGSARDDCYCVDASVRFTINGEDWRDPTEQELFMIDDELSDVVYEEWMEYQVDQADFLYDSWKDSQYE